jgi:hypothetical protein
MLTWLTKAELPHKFANVIRYGLLIVATFGTLRVTGAAQIGNYHLMTCGELRHQGQPHMACLGITVEQDNCRPVAKKQKLWEREK